ncbi:MAG: sensor histidine kinase [Paludibacteraceae bacterium]
MQSPTGSKENRIRTILLHIIGCSAFLILPLISGRHRTNESLFSFGPPEIEGFIGSVLLILFFYANYYYLLPKFIFRKKIFPWILIVLCCLSIVLFVPHKVVHPSPIEKFDKHQPPTSFKKPPHRIHPDRMFDREPPPDDKPGIFAGSFRYQETFLKFLFVLLLSFLLKTNQWWKESREEKRHAELLLLKSQINPHFLFNTLNGIYSLAIQQSQKTPEAIVKLSELMRYSVSEVEKKEVLLEDEINYLQDYIDLQKLRLGNTVDIRFDTTQADKSVKVSPMLFIFFVENSFKHGITAKKKSIIDLQIKSIGNDLFFSAKNDRTNRTGNESTKTGLKNVKRRLELIYPGQHRLTTTATETDYIVELIIQNIH